MSNRCPRCASENVYYSKKKRIWVCEECELEFVNNDSSKDVSEHKNLDASEYWVSELWDNAPTALALSYYQLHEYVKHHNIGCMLFLIRDVFELMIKIPVTILFNGIHELCDVYKSQGINALISKDSTGKSFIDKCDDVRFNYRNAAAHTEPVSRAKAEACCNDIIGSNDAAKKIGQVQGLLLELVKLTGNFK